MDNQVENLSCLKRHLRRTQISKQEKDNYFSQEKKKPELSRKYLFGFSQTNFHCKITLHHTKTFCLPKVFVVKRNLNPLLCSHKAQGNRNIPAVQRPSCNFLG